jgi:tetratricopeptide (TPR) repeat protein
MKSLRLFPLFLVLSPAFAQDAQVKPAQPPAVPGATPTGPAADSGKMSPNQQAFLNLPEERRKEFFKNLGEANRLFQQKRIFETLNMLNKADAIFIDSPETLNIRGACYVEIRAFDKAMTAFEKALQLAPDNPSVMFNIGEVYFVTKEWQKASDMLEKVVKGMPENQVALSRLIEFKILLCKKKLGIKDYVKVEDGLGKEKDKITAGGKEYTLDDDSPFYCYARAGIAYDEKKLIVAEEWLARAGRIFQNPEILAPWQDTLVEFGYIKSFYGNDLETGEE